MVELSTKPNMAGVRQSQPENFNPYTAGSGLGFLPRRGVEETGFLTTKSALERLGRGNPLRLLSYVPELHAAAGLATWNALRLSCAAGDLKITAVELGGSEQTDKAGTDKLDQLWANLPPEIGGMNGLQTTLTKSTFFTGLPFLEAVPGPRGKGVQYVWPVDSLTIKFDRDPVTTVAIPWQRQLYPRGDARNSSLVGGYRRLDTNTCFFRPVDAWPDDPYGSAPYAPALNEILCDIAMMKDLRDSIHNAAWPRTAEGFSFKETFIIAQERFGLTDPNEAAKWVDERFQEYVRAVGSRKPDDNIIHDAEGDVKVLEGSAGFTALKDILVYLRQRIVQGLKSLPTLLGINDGSTQTYTSVEFAIYAAGLETIRQIVAELLVKVANLHLQLLGLPLVAKAEYTSIRTTDAMMEAQTESIRIENAKKKIRLGWMSNEDACESVTGSAPVGEPMPGALEPTAGSGAGGSSTTDAGKTQEEKNAQKDAGPAGAGA